MSDIDGGVTSEPGIADLIGIAEPLALLPARTFAPWHRPRKQYVRRYQWFDAMRELAAQIVNDGGGEFRYLTLPGQDMLDIRFLHDELFAPLKLKLRFLAFDHGAERGSTEEVAANSSLHAVKHLPFVDVERSRLHVEAIERLASVRSAAHDDLRTFGPFHAINIDLCDGVAKHPAQLNNPTIFDVVNVLLETQSRTLHDCVLFLTTRIDAAQVDQGIRENLEHLVRRNLTECEAFALEMSRQMTAEREPFTHDTFGQLSGEEQFTIGLLKWLCQRAVRHRLSFELKSVMTYRLNPHAPADDLASIVLKVTPNRAPAVDAAGIAIGIDGPTDDEWECRFSSKMPRVLSRTTRVDDLLRTNPQILTECKAETVRLLEAASYDTSGYDEFAAG